MFLDPKERTVAIGVWVTSYSAGGAISPLIGGILLEYFWWGSVFLVGVPVMVMLLILGPILLPEFRDPKAGKLDLVSAALSLAAVLSIIYGLKKVAERGIEYESVLFFAAGIIVGALFLQRQKNLADDRRLNFLVVWCSVHPSGFTLLLPSSLLVHSFHISIPSISTWAFSGGLGCGPFRHL
jgi:MFS family permease